MRIVQGLRVRVTGSPTGGRIMKHGWECRRVGRVIHQLRRAQRSSGNRWRFVRGVVVIARGLATVHESAGRCNLGPLPLHDEPDDESGDNTETSETPYDTSSDGTGVRTSPAGVARTVCWTEVGTRRGFRGGYGRYCASRFRLA